MYKNESQIFCNFNNFNAHFGAWNKSGFLAGEKIFVQLHSAGG